jgi:hypothetical protein
LCVNNHPFDEDCQYRGKYRWTTLGCGSNPRSLLLRIQKIDLDFHLKVLYKRLSRARPIQTLDISQHTA